VPPPPPGAIADGRGPGNLPAVTWGVWEAVVIGVVSNLVIAQAIVGLIVALALRVTTTDDPNTIYVGVVVDVAWFACMVGWLALRHPGWRDEIGVRSVRERLRDVGYGFGAGLLLYPLIALAIALPLTMLFSALSGEQATTPDQLPPHLSGGTIVASVVLAVVIAPVVEETYFRGILFRSIRDRHGFWPGALISGAIFGLVHWVPAPWQDAVLLQSIMVFTGIALAWIYERRGTLLANVAAHMAFNLIGVVLILRFS
jgi:membrane protease YdiL (CAAX protease family)